MPEKYKKPFRFWKDLKRRKVIQVLAIYAGAAIVLIGLSDDVAGPFNLPQWVQRLVIILVIIGFPVTAILSWIFDLTPEGFKKTQPYETNGSGENENPKTVPKIKYNNSIAVLPFDDMSPDKDQAYFCEGIAEEIINSLTQVKRLKVIARTSAFAFKGKQMDIREIGNTLDVANVLEGSIRKDGNKVRITAQLIRVEDGYHLWSETYNKELKDIFIIQEEISLAIVEKLKMNILGEAMGGILKHYTESTVAFMHYLKGLNYYQMMTPEANQKAQENYRKAIEEDPEYSLVYAILGSNYIHACISGFISPDEAVKNAREYTINALEIDKTVPVANGTLAAIKSFYDWELEASEEYFIKSVMLNPNTAWDRWFYSLYLRFIGRIDEAIAESLYALEKDPFNIYIRSYIGLYYLLAGNTDECIQWQKSVIDLYPNGFMAFQHLGEAFEVKGMLEEAIESYEKAVTLSGGSPVAETKLSCTLHKAGRTDEARKKIEKVENMKKGVSFYVPSAPLILYYLLTKDLDNALYWLKKACDEHDFNLPLMMRTPLSEYRMPADPRFNTLLKETGLDKYMM
jgi:TolB-like protein/Tfp pilus assembly protein PilF